MGQGGEQNTVHKAEEHVPEIDSSPLAGLPDDELKRLGKAYGLKGTSKMSRDKLIAGLHSYTAGILDKDAPVPLPLEPPTFTLDDIRKAIPRHCFERSLVKSMVHLVSDVAMAAVLFYAAMYIESPLVPAWSRYLLWPAYWYAQGAVLTGVWVLSHECGHQSFSPYEWVNNLVGTIGHSFLLVPYHSWRISHGLHHNNTGSCDNDEVFCPATRSEWAAEMFEETSFMAALGIIRMFTVGWMPGYLHFNATGPPKYKGKNASHFSPESVLFKDEERAGVQQSVAAYFAMLGVIAYWIYTYSFRTVSMYYFLPLVVTNYHLVLITFLQHTDTYMPHFRGKEWSWLRGALCTVDRSFGPVLDHIFHHISDTHVCHHLFSKMPFYNAQEATKHIREFLGPYYIKDETPIGKALWRAYTNCRYVDNEGDVVFYKNFRYN